MLLYLWPQHITTLQAEYYYDINRRDSEMLDPNKLYLVVVLQVMCGEWIGLYR